MPIPHPKSLYIAYNVAIIMKEIYWNKLSPIEKIAFALGWLSILNFVFWIALLLKKFQFPKGNYKKLFNPDTYKVVFVFGWINFVCLLIALLILIVVFLFFTAVIHANQPIR